MQPTREPEIKENLSFFPGEISFIGEDYLYVSYEGMSLCTSVRRNTGFTEVKMIWIMLWEGSFVLKLEIC